MPIAAAAFSFRLIRRFDYATLFRFDADYFHAIDDCYASLSTPISPLRFSISLFCYFFAAIIFRFRFDYAPLMLTPLRFLDTITLLIALFIDAAYYRFLRRCCR